MLPANRRESYISCQLESINTRLQDLFDEIGLSTQEKDTRERDVFSVIEQALEAHVDKVSQERDELLYKCQESQENLQSMVNAIPDLLESSDPDIKQALHTSAAGQICPPYRTRYEELKKALQTIDTVFSERLTKVNQILVALEDLSLKVDGLVVPSELMPARDANPQNLNLSNRHIAELEQEIARWEQEYQTRVSQVADYGTKIVDLWVILCTPQTDIDRTILDNYRNSPERLGTRTQDVDDLRQRYQDLLNEKQSREEKLAKYKTEMAHLWDKLNEDPDSVKTFEQTHRGLAPEVLEAYERELERLREKKRQNIGLFIQDARVNLEQLWDKLYYSDNERMEFIPAFTEAYTDASLDAHEREIERLTKIVEERKPILALIDDYYQLEQEAQELEASMHDSSRLLARGPGQKRDPTRLLREEQMRKRIARRRPKVLEELDKGLQQWTTTNGRPFMVNGEDFGLIIKEKIESLKPRRRAGAPTSTTSSTASAPKHQPGSRNMGPPSSIKRLGPGAGPGSGANGGRNTVMGRMKPTGTENRPKSRIDTNNSKMAAPTPRTGHLRSISANAVRERIPVNGHGRTHGHGRPGAISASPTKLNRSPTRPIKVGNGERTVSVNSAPSASENWQTFDDSCSSEDDLEDNYLQWRENAMRKLQSNNTLDQSPDKFSPQRTPLPTNVLSPGKVRMSFNWEKDVF
uniref:ARAD1C22858p n=1 Tax=Blastobotrys adeninivorans TaxID=409370 RepID=A0A060T6T2_BLAAD